MSDMSNPPDLSHWLTKSEAAHLLGVAEKTVERMAQRQQIAQSSRKRPGQPSVAIFNPDDVERERAAKDAAASPGAFLVPSGPEPRQQPTAAVHGLLEVLQQAVHKPSDVGLSEKLYLTMKEAAALSGLPVSYLKTSMKDGRLPFLKTGAGHRIKKTDLFEL